MTRVRTEREYRVLVGQRVRLRRTHLRLTQDAVARRLGNGASQGYLSGIEHGRASIDAWRMGLIADVLDVSPAWLLDRSTRVGEVSPVEQMQPC